jgi:hypothetical protein
MVDPTRSGIGRLSRRKDIAALAIVFCFGALLNAFGMVKPVYTLEARLGHMLHVRSEAPVLAVIFVLFLAIGPAAMLGVASWLTIRWAEADSAILPMMVRYSYCLVPLGLGMWLAHYSFHFLTGLYTAVPVIQSACADIGFPVFGSANWALNGLSKALVEPLNLGFLCLGLSGSLLMNYHFAREDSAPHPVRSFVPWAVVSILLWLGSMWVLQQPMEMRATFMAG